MTALQVDAFQPIAASQDDEGLIAAFHALDRPPPGGPARPPLAQDTLLLARRGDRPVARLTYRVAEDVNQAPERTGVVGHYEALEDEAGVALLERAVDALGEEGAPLVVGPMDETTWGRYRLALPTPESGDPAPFLTEPVNPPEYPAQFEAAGFRPVEQYVSRLIPALDGLADRTAEVRKRLAAGGWAISPLDPARFGTVLDELYDLSSVAFADNPYYSRITRAKFRETYRPVRSFLDSDLVVLARDAEDRLTGFVFAFPDLIDPAGRPTRVIVKSLAVDPPARGTGIASLLIHEVHRRAADKGYDAAIHALMHVDHPSNRIAQEVGEVFRRYALFGRET
jgi:GNAT superfamily N-acetyltransferase